MTWLALVTGACRGELCTLRWPDLSQDEGELLIGDGQPQAAAAGTHRERRLTLDPGTADLLADYREHCRHEALAAGGALDEDGFVFSADGFGKTPWHPDTISHWFRQVATAAGVEITMRGLRHYEATQMLSSGSTRACSLVSRVLARGSW